LGRGGGEGGQREGKVEGQQYTSIVPLSMGATVHKLVENTNRGVNVSPVYKSVKHNAAKSVNRLILKKSWHIRFGVFIVPLSMLSPQKESKREPVPQGAVRRGR
jgi:hypothetical protein